MDARMKIIINYGKINGDYFVKDLKIS